MSLSKRVFHHHTVKRVRYNQQVVDALTTSIRLGALKAGVPVVGVYETMPTPGYDYQLLDAGRGECHPKGRDSRRVDPAPVMESTRPEGSCDLLAVEGVSVVLSGRQILDDVSFSVRAGESSRASSAPTEPARPRCCG